MQSLTRSRWAAIGAAVAVTLGAGGIGLASATSPDGAATLVPIEPCRIMDTRPDAQFNVGPRNTPLNPEETYAVAAHGDNGQCTGIPATATGLALNVTAVSATQATFLTLWGTGDRPNASHLNPAPGQPPTPNAVTTGLTPGGQFNIFNRFGNVHVLADVVGYYTDHHHDDRYYTEAEADAQFLRISQDSHAAVAYDETETLNVASTDAEVVTSLTIDTPTSGYVLVNVSTRVSTSQFQQSTVRCSLTTGAGLESNALVQTRVGENQQETLAATRGFTINKARTSTNEMTYNFVCDGTFGSFVSVNDTYMTASFIPDPDAFDLRGTR